MLRRVHHRFSRIAGQPRRHRGQSIAEVVRHGPKPLAEWVRMAKKESYAKAARLRLAPPSTVGTARRRLGLSWRSSLVLRGSQSGPSPPGGRETPD